VTIVPHAKLGWIEAFRGIAATAVVLYHTARHFDKNYGIPALESVFQFGHAGVDLFFVISGFIILFVHFDDVGRPARIWHYLGRRLTRLLPVYWLAVALTIAVSQLGGHSTNLSDVVRAILSMPIPTEPLLGVAWTLQYEFIFYVAFAVLILNRAAGLALMAAWLFAVVCTTATGWHPGLPSAYWGIFNVEFFAGMGEVCLGTNSFCGLGLFCSSRRRWPRIWDGWTAIHRSPGWLTASRVR
jgi:exopolysaccharide production protein ExoZ